MPKEPEESVMGFKDKQKALDTLRVLDGRDISYQYNVISGFVRRAKRVMEITKDEEKIGKIQDAMKVFNEWLEDYKKEGRSKENFGYLPLNIVEAYRVLAENYGVLNEDFLNAYKKEQGDYKSLREVKTPDGKVTWDIERNRKLKEIVSKMKSNYTPWYKVDDGVYQGLPTEEHVQCILLGYSPEPTKLKKLISEVIEKCQNAENSKSESHKRRREEYSSESTSDSEGEGKKNLEKRKSSKIIK